MKNESSDSKKKDALDAISIASDTLNTLMQDKRMLNPRILVIQWYHYHPRASSLGHMRAFLRAINASDFSLSLRRPTF